MEYGERLRRELNLELDGESARGVLGHGAHGHAEVQRVAAAVDEVIERVYWSMGDQLPLTHRGADETLTVRSTEARVLLPESSGIDPDVASSRRFQGTYCLWTRRGTEEWKTLSTAGALDAQGLLRGNLNALIDTELRSPPGIDSNQRLTQKIVTEVAVWQSTLEGLTTSDTVTRAQMGELLREPEWRETGAAALRGNPDARKEFLGEIYRREWEKNNLALHTHPYVPHTHTWSLWTSKGHPEDRTLVVTDRAIDALAYHQLHRDPRTRYVSLDGPATPQRDALIDKAVSLLPKDGRVVVAVGDNRDLRQSVEKSVRQRGQVLQFDPPTRYWSWRDKLVYEREHRHEPPARAAMRAHARTGPELGR